MASKLSTMVKFLEGKGINVIGTADEFYGRPEGSFEGLWISGEDEELFNYYDSSYNFGIEPKLYDQVVKRGWYFEWNDPGTVMLHKLQR